MSEPIRRVGGIDWDWEACETCEHAAHGDGGCDVDPLLEVDQDNDVITCRDYVAEKKEAGGE